MELIKLIEEGKISNKQARDFFSEMLKKEISPKELLKESGTTLISDEETLKQIINDVLSVNEQSIIDYKNGKDRALGFLVGQVMKKTQGKANPASTSKLLVEELKRR